MRAANVKPDQQLQYIIECRQSGLSDHQWCIEHGIKPSTFYNWIDKLKKRGCTSIPAPASRDHYMPKVQEIVELQVTDEAKAEIKCNEIEQSARFVSTPSIDASIELDLPNGKLRLTNNVNPMLFRQALEYLGGAYAR